MNTWSVVLQTPSPDKIEITEDDLNTAPTKKYADENGVDDFVVRRMSALEEVQVQPKLDEPKGVSKSSSSSSSKKVSENNQTADNDNNNSKLI